MEFCVLKNHPSISEILSVKKPLNVKLIKSFHPSMMVVFDKSENLKYKLKKGYIQ